MAVRSGTQPETNDASCETPPVSSSKREFHVQAPPASSSSVSSAGEQADFKCWAFQVNTSFRSDLLISGVLEPETIGISILLSANEK